jgi:ubiquinone/menaquinone biosynthesis C-methylase UbiE
LKPGMRVLDIGCGVGDVSLIAAEIVGPSGLVLGIDRAGEALEIAGRRAAAKGYPWLRFEHGDFNVMRPDETFDVLTGRFILMYLADPAGAIRRLLRQLRPRGIVAFIEMDIDASGAVPELPLLSQCIAWITRTYRSAGIEPNMGTKLYAAFRAAGLEPAMTGSCRIEAGRDAVAYEFTAETVRSLLPSMAEFGIAGVAAVGINTLADRLRDAAVAGGHCIIFPRLVGAWATTGPRSAQVA